MPDNQLDILIKFGLSKEKATEAVGELKKIETATKETGKAGVKAEEAVEEATQKTSSSKKQFQELLKGIQKQFPQLASAAKLALSPITLSFALLAASASIIIGKLKEIVDVVGNATWGTDKVNEAAEGWANFAKGVAGSKADLAELDTRLKAISEHMALIARIGKETEKNPLFARREAEAKAAEMERKAAEMRNEAAARRADAAAIAPGASEQRDKNTQAALDKDAADAAAEIAKLDAEIKAMETAYSPENRGMGRYTPDHVKFAARYGALTDPDEMIAQLKAQRGGFQGFIDRAAGNRTRNETNAARRGSAAALLGSAGDFETSAGKLEEEARRTRFGAQLNYYEQAQAQGVSVPVRPVPTPFGVTPDVKAEYEKAAADLKEIGRIWAAAMAALKADAERTASRVSNTERR